MSKAKRKLRRLRKAVAALYSAAFWRPDRELENEMELWVELRDAAGLGNGTKLEMLIQGYGGGYIPPDER